MKNKVLNTLIDVNQLRSYIFPLKKQVFLKKSKEKYLDTKLPLSYWKDFKYIAKRYGTSLWAVRNLDSAGKFIECNNGHTHICLNIFDKSCNEENIMRAFFHELAHQIQVLVGLKSNSQEMDRRYVKYDYMLKYERAAERLSYFLCKFYLNNKKSIHHRKFSAYLSSEHKEILKTAILCNKEHLSQRINKKQKRK